jgi:hypothetical protein
MFGCQPNIDTPETIQKAYSCSTLQKVNSLSFRQISDANQASGESEVLTSELVFKHTDHYVLIWKKYN